MTSWTAWCPRAVATGIAYTCNGNRWLRLHGEERWRSSGDAPNPLYAYPYPTHHVLACLRRSDDMAYLMTDQPWKEVGR